MRRTSKQHADIRTITNQPPQSLPSPAGESGGEGHSGKIPPQKTSAAAGSLRDAGGAALHETVAAEFLDRHAFLSARILHHEIQPACVQQAGDAAEPARPRPPPP